MKMGSDLWMFEEVQVERGGHSGRWKNLIFLILL